MQNDQKRLAKQCKKCEKSETYALGQKGMIWNAKERVWGWQNSIGTIFDVRSIVGRLEKSLFCKNGFRSWEFGHHACLRMWYYLCLSSFAIPAMHMLKFFIFRALKMVLHSKVRDWWESHFQSLFAPHKDEKYC